MANLKTAWGADAASGLMQDGVFSSGQSNRGGGTYIVDYVDGGRTYGIVVSPRAYGQIFGLAWSTETSITNATSVVNGFDNTNRIINNYDPSKYPIFQWSRSLTINGYSDYYVPSTNELALCLANNNLLPDSEKFPSVSYPYGLFWTSTEYNNTSAYYGPTYQSVNTSSKASTQVSSIYLGVRAIRRFLKS